jgi:hypothetical protein
MLLVGIFALLASASAEDPHADSSCDECHPDSFVERYEDWTEQQKFAFSPGHEATRRAIALSEADRLELHARCRDCHEEEFDDWRQSGHAMSYSQVFLDRRHNKRLQLNDDCLRCHGMFFLGTVRDLVTPLDTLGPWQLKQPGMRDQPSIPCLACHQIHPDQYTTPQQTQPDRLRIEGREPARCGFYDRRETRFFSVDRLPHPRVQDAGVDVSIAQDQRLRICYQCHAPQIGHQVGSGDDKTPRGVHDGLSCFDCHQGHSMRAQNSCSDCHPAESHCGIDVRRMDTSYNSKFSAHDVHTVSCTDCHSEGVPASSAD